jgi:hypothetical protein
MPAGAEAWNSGAWGGFLVGLTLDVEVIQTPLSMFHQ